MKTYSQALEKEQVKPVSECLIGVWLQKGGGGWPTTIFRFLGLMNFYHFSKKEGKNAIKVKNRPNIGRSAEGAAKFLRKRPFLENLGLYNASILRF